MDLAEGAGEAVLDEIICSNDIARKDARVACHTRNESFNFSVKLLIERPEAETLPVSGLFQAGDSTSFANAVAQTYGLTVVTRQAQIVVSGIPTSRGAITWGGTTPE